jgi:carboxylesterase type B
MRKLFVILLAGVSLAFCFGAVAQPTRDADSPAYHSERNIVYANVDGKDLKLNAFLPANAKAPAPAIVEIHGGWFYGGDFASSVEGVGGWQLFMRHGLAVFSIQYRLGEAG